MRAPKLFSLVGLFVATFVFPWHITPVLGFVGVLNPQGDKLHWELLKPSPSVHTNVVNPITKAVRYYLAANAYSTTNTSNELNALRSAFAQWQSVPGTHLKFEDAGLVAPGPGVDINTTDNTNIVFWAKNGTLINGGRDDMRGTFGLAYQDFFEDEKNTMVEADIVLNGDRYGWFTDFTATASLDLFVDAIALHEIGHFIGLNHSPVGGSTMFVRGGKGVGTQPGLSLDERAAVLWLYPTPNLNLGTLSGVVTMSGKGVLGATVAAEDAAGNLVQSTATRSDGSYEIPSLLPGLYKLRVCPLDPAGAKAFMMTGQDIDPFGTFADAETGFLPSAEVILAISAAGATKHNFDVVAAGNTPILRITRIRLPSELVNTFASVNTAALVRQGSRQLTVGVFGPNLPTSGATLIVTGDGITHGPVTFLQEAFVGLNLVSVKIDVAEDATPGLRSFVLMRGDQVAYANGFLEVQPRLPDFNFDGVDDVFQRKYFNLFTAAEAGPEKDPDGDGFSNLQESLAGTSPLDAKSVFAIESVTHTHTPHSTTVRWRGAPGHRYQVLSRRDLDESAWEVLGEALGVEGLTTEFVDKSPEGQHQFYRVVGIR